MVGKYNFIQNIKGSLMASMGEPLVIMLSA